jgi:site-specific recombinase XerD
MVAIASSRGGHCLSTEYVNVDKNLLWKCGAGHQWSVKSASIRNGSWCPPRKSNESDEKNDAWEHFLAQAKARKLRPTTIYKYDLLRRRMRDFAQRQGLRLLKEFDLDVLETLQSEWQEGAISCMKKLERLKSFFRAALIRRWVDENPAGAMRGPKIRPRPTLPFTREEMGKILAAVEHYPDKSGRTGRANALRLRAFVLVLRYAGLRIGDATSLSTDRLAGSKIFLPLHGQDLPARFLRTARLRGGCFGDCTSIEREAFLLDR